MLAKYLPPIGRVAGLPRLLVLAALPVALCHCDDGSSTRIRGLKDEIQSLHRQVDDTRSQVSRLESQIEASRAEKKKVEEDKTKVEEERAATEKELEQLRKDFETYKTNYKLSMRKRAPGFPLNDFTTTEGKSFTHVVLREITDTQINFTHDGGIMKLHYKQLPESIQGLLGFLIANESPRNTMAMTAKQINAQRRADKDGLQAEAEGKIKNLRDEREKMLRTQSKTKQTLLSAESHGSPVAQLKRDLDQIDLYLRQLNNQILQAEVDLHRVRSEKLKLEPEK